LSRNALFDDLEFFISVAGGEDSNKLAWLKAIGKELHISRTPFTIRNDMNESTSAHILKSELVIRDNDRLRQKYM